MTFSISLQTLVCKFNEISALGRFDVASKSQLGSKNESWLSLGQKCQMYLKTTDYH